MTLTIVPAPSLSRRSARATAQGSRSLTALPMPVPATPGTTRMRYGLAAVDLHGRVADRALYDALGWRPGQTLRLTVTDRSVVAAPDAGGAVRIGATGHLRLPAGLRRRCGLTTGDRVLLAADLGARVLVLHPPAALDALLATHHASVLGETTS